MSGIPGYLAQASVTYGAAIEVASDNGLDRWISFYNDTGGALTNGAVKLLTFKVASGVLRPVVIAVATNTGVANTVCVVDNSIVGQGTVPDASWGFVKVRGSVLANVDGTNDIVAGDQLQVIDSGTAFIDQGGAEGAVINSDTSAIALEAYTTNSIALKSVLLLGSQSSVAAS